MAKLSLPCLRMSISRPAIATSLVGLGAGREIGVRGVDRARRSCVRSNRTGYGSTPAARIASSLRQPEVLLLREEVVRRGCFFVGA